MKRDGFPSPAFDSELSALLRTRVELIRPQGDPMTEFALRGSLRQRRRRTLALAGAAVAAAAVVAFVVAGPSLLASSPAKDKPVGPAPSASAPTTGPSSSPTAARPRQPAQGEVAATIKLPAADSTDPFLPGAAVAYDHVFVHIQRKPLGILVKVDPDTDVVVDSVTFPKDARLADGAIPVTAAGALWWPGRDAVFRLDPGNLDITATISTDGEFDSAIASDGKRVWVIAGLDRVAEIDTTTNRLGRSVAFSYPAPGEARLLTYAAGSLWVAAGPSMVQLDPDDLTIISRTALPEVPSSILAVGETVWVSLPKLDQLLRVGANGIEGPPVQLPPGHPGDEYDPQLAANSDGTTVWSMTNDNQLVAVDVASGQVVDHIIQVHNQEPHSMVAVRGRTVWVPGGQHPELRRFEWQPPQR